MKNQSKQSFESINNNLLNLCSLVSCKFNMSFTCILLFVTFMMSVTLSFAESIEDIVEESGFSGGIIVQIGFNVKQLTELSTNQNFLIHAVDIDEKKIEIARKEFYLRGINNKVFVDKFDGKVLPYIENSINLLISENIEEVKIKEILRILVPNGIAYIKKDGKWNKTVKPENPDVDEWTHYRYDATNNSVANDKVVASPRRLQWNGAPRWCRHHEHTSSLDVIVSAGGKIFYIMDEGAKTSIMLDSKVYLTGRDAYNGVVLWKRPIEKWSNHLICLKKGPVIMTRSLIATKQEVYVTLGINAPVTALNPNTGETIRTYEKTKGTEEIIYSKGILFLSINPSRSDLSGWNLTKHFPKDEFIATTDYWDTTRPDTFIIKALIAKSGTLLWEKETSVVTGTITADDESFYFNNGENIICLNKETGENKWISDKIKSSSNISTMPVFFHITELLHKLVQVL